jgi:hypothetical protein
VGLYYDTTGNSNRPAQAGGLDALCTEVEPDLSEPMWAFPLDWLVLLLLSATSRP